MAIHPDTSIGSVALAVSDLERAREFYEHVIGLKAIEREDGSVALGANGGHPLVVLQGDSGARPPDRHATGLFHLAILLPSRRDLALALRRLSDAPWPLDGASDHLVSEALYLSDPEGNGIEIYRDRRREEWPRSGDQLEMPTLPLDLRSVISELEPPGEQQPAAPAHSRVGHVHLKVADIAEAEEFYAGALGFDVVVRGYPGALFVSAGGYHHHIGLNTWHSAGGSRPPAGAAGLRSFEVVLPDNDELERTLEQLGSAGVTASRENGRALAHDPSGNAVALTARS